MTPLVDLQELSLRENEQQSGKKTSLTLTTSSKLSRLLQMISPILAVAMWFVGRGRRETRTDFLRWLRPV
jgi:hypothetical protein